MTYKICQVIFSTNRLEYLTRTLRAQRNLNYYGCEVHKIFIDDYPKTRNDLMITELVKLYGYNEINLHPENLGLSVTWSQFWDLMKERDYDYIWHQEDDVDGSCMISKINPWSIIACKNHKGIIIKSIFFNCF